MLELKLENQKPSYRIISSFNPEETYPIDEFFIIGSDEISHLKIKNDQVSPRHARIEKKETGYFLRDLMSFNGTFLNGERIKEAFLESGDIIRIGDQEFIFSNQEQSTPTYSDLTSKNILWAEQLKKIPSIARKDFTVLLTGPTGSGKDVIAKKIHKYSNRSQGPFVSVNCCALSESLIESELFGHVKGSFTGALTDRKGAFESARGGTLFLDEIGDLPIDLQAKLLRALENQEIKPVGSDNIIKTDVRIIAATHQNLKEKIKKSLFRMDLYYRLNTIEIKVPSLRQRSEDLESLFYEFAKKNRIRFSFNAIQKLKEYSWPGNIRELKSIVERASALFQGLTVNEYQLEELLPPQEEENISSINNMTAAYTTESKNSDLSVVQEIERDLIIQKLIQNKGNQRKSAGDLRMPKSTMHDRIKAYGIKIDELLN